MFVHFCIKEKMTNVYDFFFVFDFIFYRYNLKEMAEMELSLFKKGGIHIFTYASCRIHTWHNDKSFHSHLGKQMETWLAPAAISLNVLLVIQKQKTVPGLDIFVTSFNTHTNQF